MLIFIYGNDTFRVRQKVRVMKMAFAEKFDPTGLNTAEFSGALKPGEVIQAACAMPFMGKKRMVVVRDLIDATKKVDMDVWVQGLIGVPESSIVVFWETAAPKKLEKKPLYKALQEASEVHHYAFPQLEDAALSRWVAGRAKERGGRIARAALSALMQRVGADLWQMDQEISKLVAYADGLEIDVAMVDELVEGSFEGKIFALIDAVSKRQPAQALQLLRQERLSGASDHYLLTMLERQVRILLGARSLLDENPRTTKQDVATAMGLHPFVAQKAIAQARTLSVDGLRMVHDRLFAFDQEMKTSQTEADVATDLTVAQLLQ